MRGLLLAMILCSTAANAAPYTITMGDKAAGSEVFGPADLICDLNKCRMFTLPVASHVPANAIIEFGQPKMTGQDRIVMRRCIELCRAIVTGVRIASPTRQESQRPEIYITPSELLIQ